MSGLENLLRRLDAAGVDFVIVGGFAATAHGSTRLTRDLDVCIPFERSNLERVIQALGGCNPCLRAHPPRPLPADPSELVGYKNLYLRTDEGELDLLGEVAGVGGWPQVRAQAIVVRLWDREVRLLGLDALIASKRALAREKDAAQLAELEVIRARSRQGR